MTDWQQKTAALLRADLLRLACLQAARALQLPDWYLAAGFLRNAIWDAAHRPEQVTEQAPGQMPGQSPGQSLHMTPLNDIDLVFYQPFDCNDASNMPRRWRRKGSWPRS